MFIIHIQIVFCMQHNLEGLLRELRISYNNSSDTIAETNMSNKQMHYYNAHYKSTLNFF